MFRRFRAFEAPANLTFKDPDTGHVYKSTTFSSLYTDIIRYRQQNNLEPLEGLREVVENYLCGLPENNGKCQQNTEMSRSFSQYVQGGIALLKNIAYRKFASQREAEERAHQCLKCEFNVFPDKGNFLNYADNIAIMQVGERKTSLDKDLGNCAVCTCVLRSKVHYDGKLNKFSAEELVKLKKVNCWQLKLSGQG